MKFLSTFLDQIRDLSNQTKKIKGQQKITNTLDSLVKEVQQQIEKIQSAPKNGLPTEDLDDNGFLYAKYLTALTTLIKQIEAQIFLNQKSNNNNSTNDTALKSLKDKTSKVIMEYLKDPYAITDYLCDNITDNEKSEIKFITSQVLPAAKINEERLNKIINDTRKWLSEFNYNFKDIKRFQVDNINDPKNKVNVITFEHRDQDVLDSECVHIIRFCGNGETAVECLQEAERDLSMLQKSGHKNVKLTFLNYTGVMSSTGEATWDNCVASGMSVVEYYRSVGVPAKNIILKGQSLGGAVATKVAHNLHFPKNPSVDKYPVGLVNIRSFSNISNAAAAIIPLPSLLTKAGVRVLAPKWKEDIVKLYLELPAACKMVFMAEGDNVVKEKASLLRGIIQACIEKKPTPGLFQASQMSVSGSRPSLPVPLPKMEEEQTPMEEEQTKTPGFNINDEAEIKKHTLVLMTPEVYLENEYRRTKDEEKELYDQIVKVFEKYPSYTHNVPLIALIPKVLDEAFKDCKSAQDVFIKMCNNFYSNNNLHKGLEQAETNTNNNNNKILSPSTTTTTTITPTFFANNNNSNNNNNNGASNSNGVSDVMMNYFEPGTIIRVMTPNFILMNNSPANNKKNISYVSAILETNYNNEFTLTKKETSAIISFKNNAVLKKFLEDLETAGETACMTLTSLQHV